MLLMQAQENEVDLDEDQLFFLASGQTNTFDADVDDEPTMFMANLDSADPVYDEACLTYDSDILSKDNEEQVVQSDVSSIPNDALMMIINDIDTQYATNNAPNKAIHVSLTAKLDRYKELAKTYKQRAKFNLTEREMIIDTQMRMIIKDHNFKEESLQKDLYSVKVQLNSTINHNKLIREELSTVAIGYKNPFYLFKSKQVQHALYIGQDIVKPNHARVLVHDSEDTLEIAETTRKQMNKKLKD
uniref:Retrovirus-related Pol polyprotein from transposon TNT 1-94 n=1 Tax=Tanacetum cinerariifolium TaxID=118510 RepID=A0A6L2JF71_TANCI|nr:hypothetical protein [Tanacetum cinerariifolium]